MSIKTTWGTGDAAWIDYVPTPTPGKYTINVWVKRIGTTASRSNYIFKHGGSTTNNINVYSWNGSLTMARLDGSGNDNERYADSGFPLNTNPHWFSFSWDDTDKASWVTTAQIWRDGVALPMLQGTDNNPNWSAATSGSFVLAANHNQTGELDGYLAEFSVCKGILTQDQIHRIHNGEYIFNVVSQQNIITYAPFKTMRNLLYGFGKWGNPPVNPESTPLVHPIIHNKSKSKVHIRQEIPKTPVTDLFPNTVFYDTFTDTNGTLIDSHTPDTHTFSYGWEKLGATSYPQIQNNRLTFNADGSINTARLNTGIDITTNAIKLTGKIVQSISSTEAISIYIGDDQLSTSYYIPKNGFQVGFNSNLDIVSIKVTNNEIETSLLWSDYDYGSAGDSQYFEIICYSNGVNEVRIWPVRTAIGGGEVPFDVDYPIDPLYRNRIFQDEWVSSGLKRIVLSTWYGSANQWSMDWLKIESSAQPLVNDYPGIWNRRTQLNIQSSQVNSTLTDFPVLFTEANLPSEMFDSDGLYSAQNGGGDIRFTSDVDGKYLLPCEVVDFVTDPNPANGKAQIWVKVPSISSSANTTIYVWYNTADTKTQYPDTHDYGRNAVWSDYEFVSHDIVVDSTGNHTINITGTEPHNGRFGTKYGALGFGTTLGDATTDVAVTSLTAHNNLRTYQVWAYRNGAGGGSYARIFDKNTSGSANLETCFVDTNSANQATYYVRDWSTADENKGIKPPLPTGAWYKLDITYDSSSEANSVLMYQQGVSQSLYEVTNSSGTLQTSTDPYIIGNRGDGLRNWDGYLAEFRIRNSILSADWLDAEYTNQNTPATFVQVGENAHAGHLLPNVILDLHNLTGSITAIDDPDITPGNDNDDWLTVT